MNGLTLIKKGCLYITGCCALFAHSPTVFSQTQTPKIYYQVIGVKNPILTHINSRLKEIKKQLSIQTDTQVKSWQLQSEQTIRDTLQAFGYFKATLRPSLHKKPHGYQSIYRVSLGPLLPITQIDIQVQGPGKQNKALQNIINMLVSFKGQGMTTETYQKIKRMLYKTAISEGYLDAHWALHTVLVDLDHYTANIRLTLNTGLRYEVGKIQFSPNPLSQEFLKRYLPFKEGDAYRLSDILNLQTTLKDTGYFQKAAVQTQDTEETTKIPLMISLVPASKYYYTAGGGLSSDAWIHFKAEGLIRRITPTGHQLSGTFQLSRAQKSLLGLYTIPGKSPTTRQHHIQLEIANYYLNQVKTDTQLLGFLSTYRYPEYKLTQFIHWHRETFTKPENNTPDTVYLWMPGFAISRINTDWFKNNHHYKLHWQTQIALKPFLSNINFLKTEYDSSYFGALPEWNPNSYLVARLRMGYILTSDINKIPPSLSFYAGGYRYPRGHEEYKLGKSVFAFSTEYRQYLFGLFYLTPFTDMSYDIHQPTALKASTGMGLCLWYPSIGNIEISYAKVFDRTHNTYPWKWIARISTDL